MSIKDLKMKQVREDGKVYESTLGTLQEDREKQAKLLEEEREEKRRKRQLRKEKWAAWRTKWFPRIWELIKILALIAVVGALIYFLFWVALIGIGLAAMGGGVSEGARSSQSYSDALYEQRQDNIRRMQQQKIYDQQHRRRR